MKRTTIITILSLLIALNVNAQSTTKAGRSFVSFTAVPLQQEYAEGQKAMIRVVATAGGGAVDGVEIEFEAGQENLRTDTTGTAVFSNGEAVLNIGTMYRPGFRRCKLKFMVEGESYRDDVTVAYATRHIRPTVTEPSDFDAFWKKTLREASKVPMTYELEDDAEHTNDQYTTQRVKLQSYSKGNYIYGYLSRPRNGKQHPVMLRVPGAGVKRVEFDDSYVKMGFTVLSIGINGIPANVSDSLLNVYRSEIGDYWVSGLESRETYYYRKIYCSLVRSIDFLTSQQDWNGRDVAVTGGSQGGALTMVAAGLDPRVNMLVAFYPALCDIGGYARGTTGGWPNIGKPGSKDIGVPSDKWLTTASYYDVALFAKRIKAPGFYSYGYNDATCAPTSTCGAINNVTAEKVVVTTPASGHWRFTESNAKAKAWVREQLAISNGSSNGWKSLADVTQSATMTQENGYERYTEGLPVKQLRVNNAVTTGIDGTIYYTCILIKSHSNPALTIEYGQYMNMNHKGRLMINGEIHDGVGQRNSDGTITYDLTPFGKDLYIWGVQKNVIKSEIKFQ